MEVRGRALAFAILLSWLALHGDAAATGASLSGKRLAQLEPISHPEHEEDDLFDEDPESDRDPESQPKAKSLLSQGSSQQASSAHVLTGGRRAAAVVGKISAAPIDVLRKPHTFLGRLDNGEPDFINFRDRYQGNFGGDFSVAFRGRFNDIGENARIIDFGNGLERDNIVVGRKGLNHSLQFAVYRRERQDGDIISTSRSLVAENVLRPNETASFLCQVDTKGHMRIWKDGTLVAQRKDGFSPDQVPRVNMFVGKSNWPQDSSFVGHLESLRVWNVNIAWAKAFPDSPGGDERSEASARHSLMRRDSSD